MLRKLFFTLGLLLLTGFSLYAQQGILKGTVTDAETKEPLPYVNVVIEQNGEYKGGTSTDFDGTYTLRNLSVGSYDIRIKYIGYQEVLKTGVHVSASGFSTGGDVALKQSSTVLDAVEVIEYQDPLIQKGSAESGQKINSEDIGRMPATSVDGIVATVGGVSYADGGAGTARGEGGMVTYVNGVRKRGAVNMPKKAIAEIQVILGGTPARYGESMGGTTNITLQPPANKFLGFLRYETSEPQQQTGYHRLDFYFTGPLYTKKAEDGSERSVLGYRLSGWGNYIQDPYAIGVKSRYHYMAKPEVQKMLDESPLIFNPATYVISNRAEFLRKNDFHQVARKPNLWGTGFYVEGGLDVRFSDNATLQVNGEFTYSQGKQGGSSSFLLNNAYNGNSQGYSQQLMANFTHRFPSSEESKSLFKNFSYNFTGSYSRSYGENFHQDHGDNVFRYGHVGTFSTEKRAMYDMQSYLVNGADVMSQVQNGWRDAKVDFTPSPYNPGLARYTQQLFEDPDFAPIRSFLTDKTQIESFQGFYNGGRPKGIYGMFSNVNTPTGSFGKSETQYIYVSARATAEIKGHQLEFGLQYDQSISRSYSLGASSLWTIMRQEANTHILYMDLDNPMIDETGTFPKISFDRRYDAEAQTFFDKAIRKHLGLSINGTEWVDIDSYDPSTFSLDMLSPDGMFNSGRSIVSYTGYDHTGKMVSGKRSLQEFFGSASRTLGAWQPTYMAGYIQDQFYFKDLIFNIGIRVDRFDGNQMVLKDPYLLYEAKTVAEVEGNRNSLGKHPENVGSDYVVYVDNLSRGDANVGIMGYRHGDTWYDAAGKLISDPRDIAGDGAQALPYRKGDLLATGFPKEISVNAFKDYEPKVIAMPRIAFSFPVSDESQFKASYDMIARRPGAQAWQANYQSYMFMSQLGEGILSNPDLNPERVTNYELGFQQLLSKSSAIGITVYYKETRDLIQMMQYVGGDPNPNYSTFGNIDFKTTKGFTISYDLRRSKNTRINANYTLQYADGTGLPGATLQSLIRAGYPTLKMLAPISDDRRHEFKLSLDFRYATGKDYNGPVTSKKVTDKDGNERVKNIKWLESFGFNMISVAQSGRPYTKLYSNMQQTIVGSYQGARLPWIFNVDMQMEKGFDFKVGKRNTHLVAFVRASNIFNIKNISSVYGVTGDPDDNGYLTDPETQSSIESQIDPQSYRDYYQISMNGRYNYTRPRMIYIGFTYTF